MAARVRFSSKDVDSLDAASQREHQLLLEGLRSWATPAVLKEAVATLLKGDLSKTVLKNPNNETETVTVTFTRVDAREKKAAVAKAPKAAAAKKADSKKPDAAPQMKKGKNQEGLAAKKLEDFPTWYTQVITKSEMIDYYDISG
jgi:hypothetical protein